MASYLHLVSDNADPRPNLNDQIGASGCSTECDETVFGSVWRAMGAAYCAGFVSCLALFGLGLWLVELAR